MNRFYTIPKVLQWVIAILMVIVAIIILGKWTDLTGVSAWYYLMIFILVPFISFLATPIFKLTGAYYYLNPMVLVFSPSKKKYDLHNGTSFDYMMVMRNTKPGKSWQTKMLGYYIGAIMIVIDKIESGELPPTINIQGSSYFFSESTAKRLGFAISETGIATKLNLLMNYIDLTWTLSLSKGKLEFPNLFNIKTATISGSDLLKKKDKLQSIAAFLESR